MTGAGGDSPTEKAFTINTGFYLFKQPFSGCGQERKNENHSITVFSMVHKR